VIYWLNNAQTPMAGWEQKTLELQGLDREINTQTPIAGANSHPNSNGGFNGININGSLMSR